MMLNPMAAGRPEPQWTQYEPDSGTFEDCEYRVEEMEILGVKQKYIIIRGAILIHTNLSIDMPEGVKVHYPFDLDSFTIQYMNLSGDIQFSARDATMKGSLYRLYFPNVFGAGSRFVLFTRIQ